MDLDAAVAIRERGDADDRVQFEKGEGRRWIVEINLPCGELFLQSLWQCICVNLRDLQKVRFLAKRRGQHHHYSRLQWLCAIGIVTPESLTPECLEAECLLAVIKHCLRVVRDVRIKGCLGGGGGKTTTAPMEPAPSAAIIVVPILACDASF